MKGEMDNSTMSDGDFNTHFSETDKSNYLSKM